MEEQASTAHCVGLKHTILLSFVTLGSVVNFCDVLMAGGTSRSDHSEVGSGFIHFNFTPWGAKGDKATPSQVGDVVHGVFLRERRIFLGGCSGMVGPCQVGYGAVTAAGQVIRRDVAADHLVMHPPRAVDRALLPGHLDRVDPRAEKNVAYIAQLVALRAWYRQVRLARVAIGISHTARRMVLKAAIETLELCLAERLKRLEAFMAERDAQMPVLNLDPQVPCPLPVEPTEDEAQADHVAWVQALPEEAVFAGVMWLQRITDAVMEAS